MCYEVRRCISVIDPRFSVTDRRIKIPKNSAGLAVDFFFPNTLWGMSLTKHKRKVSGPAR